MRGLFLLCVGLMTTPLFGNTKQPWLAFGDLRGDVSPCGCDPVTDLGGIRRLSRFIAATRKDHPATVVFSLGGNAPLDKKEAGKARAIQEALLLLKPEALLARGLEMKDPIPANLPYVLSNSRKRPAGVKESVTVGPWVVLGFDEQAPHARPYSAALEKSWRKILAEHKDKKAVLLFAGKTPSLERIKKTGLFSEIISANTAPANAEPTQKEKEEPGRLLRTAGVYMVPSFGQGVLRGGSLRTPPRLSLPLDCKPGSLEPRCQKKPTLMEGGANLFTWLDLSWEGPSPADAIFAAYNEGAAHVFAERALERAKHLKTSPFVGAAACASCHPAAFQAWEKSKHAHAWNSLKTKNKDQDPECVSCHVLGYEAKGGFADMDSSPQFANVQCESCHGPRREHAANPAIKPKHDAHAACAGCHTPPHSPGFNMESYWRQIKH